MARDTDYKQIYSELCPSRELLWNNLFYFLADKQQDKKEEVDKGRHQRESNMAAEAIIAGAK